MKELNRVESDLDIYLLVKLELGAYFAISLSFMEQVFVSILQLGILQLVFYLRSPFYYQESVQNNCPQIGL